MNATAPTSRVEPVTLSLALSIHAGFMALTLFAVCGSVLLAWYGSLQHETIHGHPTSSRRLNGLLGALPLSLWLPYTLYRESHLRHHRHEGHYLTDVDRKRQARARHGEFSLVMAGGYLEVARRYSVL